MTKLDRKKRPRRIAPDEAHAWARNLRLNNPNAKLTLSMLSLYVNSEGYCFVGIPTLAEDTELSAQTVRNRLAWLEQVGAIARLPQWLDEYGNRSSNGTGKRTSDLIRLMIDVDVEEIEDAASGAVSAVSREVSPMPQTGLNPAAETVSTTPALRQPYDSAEGLNSEPEPESPLRSPPGTSEAVASLEISEPEHFAPAWAAWPGHQVMRRDLALTAFRDLTAEQQVHCRAAIPSYTAEQTRLGRKHTMNFHLWIRTKGFEEFPGVTLAPVTGATAGGLVEVASAAGVALIALYGVAKAVRPFESHGKFVYRGEITPRILALANAGNSSSWRWIEDKAQIAAWSGFVAEHVKSPRRPMITTRGLGADERSGIYAPWAWPPRKDGTLSPDATAATDDGEIS